MNKIFKQNSLNAIVFKLQLIYSTEKNSKVAIAQLYNEVQLGLQLYYVKADPKVGEQHIYRKYSKCNGFQVTTDLLNSENLKIAVAQL